MKHEVSLAVRDLRRAFSPSEVLATEDADGGSHVIVEDVVIGSQYIPSSTWIGGHISALHPYADIYPLFIGGDVRRADGVAFEPPVTSDAQFLGRSALQISRRNNRTQDFPQTAVAKFLKVLHFLEQLR